MKRAPALAVSEERGIRTLHVGGEAIQSSMRLSDPYALELDYTRCMLAFLLFHPRPRRALKGAPPRFDWDLLKGRAQALERRYGLPFTRYVPRFRRMNRCDAQALIIAGPGSEP